MLDGVYRSTEGVPVFHAARAPTSVQLQALLSRIIKRLMRLLTRKGYLIEEQGMTYLADSDPEAALGPRSRPCPYRFLARSPTTRDHRPLFGLSTLVAAVVHRLRYILLEIARVGEVIRDRLALGVAFKLPRSI